MAGLVSDWISFYICLQSQYLQAWDDVKAAEKYVFWDYLWIISSRNDHIKNISKKWHYTFCLFRTAEHETASTQSCVCKSLLDAITATVSAECMKIDLKHENTLL